LLAGGGYEPCFPRRDSQRQAPISQAKRQIKDSSALEGLIASTEPEFVAVQEWGGYEHAALRSASGWHVHASTHLFFASRYPIQKVVDLGDDSM